MAELATDTAIAEIGHNLPPALPDRLAEDYSQLVAEVEALAQRANAAPEVVNDDAEQGVIGNLAKDVTKTAKNIEARRVDEKEPFLKAGREVDGFFQPLKVRLDRIASAMEIRGRDYLNRKAAAERRVREEEERKRREAERLAREEAQQKLREAEAREREAHKAQERAERLRLEEEARHAKEVTEIKNGFLRETEEREAARQKAEAETAARLRAEEDERAAKASQAAAIESLKALERAEAERLDAERAAQAKPADLARTRSSGSLSTLAQKFDHEIVDFEAIDLEVLRPYLPRADIEKAIRQFIRVNKDTKALRGVRIFETTRANLDRSEPR